MDQLYPFYLACYSIINFSLAKTMKLNTEYPTKDWLKTSENARPLDIIWEKKPLTDFNFVPIILIEVL